MPIEAGVRLQVDSIEETGTYEEEQTKECLAAGGLAGLVTAVAGGAAVSRTTTRAQAVCAFEGRRCTSLGWEIEKIEPVSLIDGSVGNFVRIFVFTAMEAGLSVLGKLH